MNKTFHYVSAEAGSGKTHSLHNYIAANDDFYTIATQTNALSHQQFYDLTQRGIKSRVISLDTVGGKCTKTYARHCQDVRNGVVLVNQSVALSWIEEAAHQHLFVDEYFSPVTKIKLKDEFSGSHDFIANLFKAEETEFPGIYEIVSTEQLAEYAKRTGAHSSLKDHVHDACRMAHSPHYRLFVGAKNYRDFQANVRCVEEDSEEKDSRQTLTMWAWLQPSILDCFASATLMGANFFRSKIYLAWRNMVNFAEHPDIKGERYSNFAHKASYITVRYLSEDDVSMYRLEKIGYQVFADDVAQVVEAAYPDTDYLVTLSAKKNFEWNGKNGEHISPNAMGLNQYQDLHMALHLAPLNPSDEDAMIWQAIAGVSHDQLMAAQAYESQYQFFTRPSIRDGKMDHDVSYELVFICLDRRSADNLVATLGVEKEPRLLDVPCLSGYVKPPRKTRSDKKPIEVRRAKTAAKVAAHRAKKASAAEQPSP